MLATLCIVPGRCLLFWHDGNAGKETKGSRRIQYFDMQPNKKFNVNIFTYEFVTEAADSKCWMSELHLLQFGFLRQHSF